MSGQADVCSLKKTCLFRRSNYCGDIEYFSMVVLIRKGKFIYTLKNQQRNIHAFRELSTYPLKGVRLHGGRRFKHYRVHCSEFFSRYHFRRIVRGFTSSSEICSLLLVIGVNPRNLTGVLISVLCGGKLRIYYSFTRLFAVHVGDQHLYLTKKKIIW